MFKNWVKHLRKFKTEEDGFVVITFLLLIVPAFVILGLVVDYGRAQMAQDRLYVAAEQAALTAAYYADLPEETRLNRARTIFDANFNNGSLYFREASFDLITPGTRTTDRAFVSATLIVETSILGIMNYPDFTVRLQAAAECSGNAPSRSCSTIRDRLPTNYN